MIFTSPPLAAIKILHGCQDVMFAHKCILSYRQYCPHIHSTHQVERRSVEWTGLHVKKRMTVSDSTNIGNKYLMFLLNEGVRVIKAKQMSLNIICLWCMFRLPVVTCSDHSNHRYWRCSYFSSVALCIYSIHHCYKPTTLWGCSPCQLTHSPLPFSHSFSVSRRDVCLDERKILMMCNSQMCIMDLFLVHMRPERVIQG